MSKLIEEISKIDPFSIDLSTSNISTEKFSINNICEDSENSIQILVNDKIEENNNYIEKQDKILFYRENRKIISIIKKTINKFNIEQNFQVTKNIIKNILLGYNNNIKYLIDDKKNTLLHIYVKESILSNIKLIVESYLDILNDTNDLYEMLFFKNIDNLNVFELSVIYENFNIIKYLFGILKNENNINEFKKHIDYLIKNIFNIAVKQNKYFSIIYFYEQLQKYSNKNVIDIPDDENQITPLHISCNIGNKNIMDLLLNLGADINYRDKKGYTPLHYAVLSENEIIIKKLIIRGANKFIKDNNNMFPYDLCEINGNNHLKNLLFRQNCLKRIFIGDKIMPILKNNKSKFKNFYNYFLISFNLFLISIKSIILFVLYLYLNSKSINSLNFAKFNNTKENENLSKIDSLNDFFTCINDNCKIEFSIIIISFIIDILLFEFLMVFKCFSNKIYLEKKSSSEVESLAQLYELNKNICVNCRIATNKKINHCLICERCVQNWDHHCFWLNVCINDENYLKFKIFIVLLILFLFLNTIFFIDLIHLVYSFTDVFVERVINIQIFTKIIITIISSYLALCCLYAIIFMLIPTVKNLFYGRIK